MDRSAPVAAQAPAQAAAQRDSSPDGAPADRQAGALAARIHDSPPMLAQRRRIAAAFGPAHGPAQRVPNRTGMPDALKSGVESLSGMDLSDVRVHANSSRPAQLHALAYAQGNDIHLAPGQGHHLAHEAWHVVQQRQGRVRPTLDVGGQGVNDDAGLEREADAMGAAAQSGAVQRAAAQRAAPPAGAGANVVQRVAASLNIVSAPKLDTQKQVIARELNVAAGAIDLPGTHVLGTIERPQHVQATINGDGRGTERENHNNMKKVTALARGEAKLVLGANIPAYYQAGHLIGDQFFKADAGIDTMQLGNLAPQYAGFNTPAYAQIMEAPVAALQTGGPATQVDAEVRLAYPGDTYRVSVEDLVRRGVVTQNAVDNGGKNLAPTDTLEFPSRIPSQWRLDVAVRSGEQLPLKTFLKGQNQAGEKHSTALDPATAQAPGFGKGYEFIVSGAIDGPFGVSVPQGAARSLAGVQWYPPRDGPRPVDIITSVENLFPDLADREELIAALQEPRHPLVGEMVPYQPPGHQQQPGQEPLGAHAAPQRSVLDALIEEGLLHLRHHAFMVVERIRPLNPDQAEQDYVIRELSTVHQNALAHILQATSALDLLQRQFQAQSLYFVLAERLIAEILHLRQQPLQGPTLPERMDEDEEGGGPNAGPQHVDHYSITLANE